MNGVAICLAAILSMSMVCLLVTHSRDIEPISFTHMSINSGVEV